MKLKLYVYWILDDEDPGLGWAFAIVDDADNIILENQDLLKLYPDRSMENSMRQLRIRSSRDP